MGANDATGVAVISQNLVLFCFGYRSGCHAPRSPCMHLHMETQANNINYIPELSTPLACKDNYCGLMEIFANMTGFNCLLHSTCEELMS